jgi:hypothetical protein
MIKCYDECSAILGKLSGSTEEWHKTFSDVKQNLKKREEARKIHDHYDEKMEKLIEEKHKKMENNEEETEEEIQKFDRNEAKYKRAVSDYVTLSSNTYKLMEDLSGMRFKIINQMVKTFIEQEKKFFETCYFLINNFYKGMGIMDLPSQYQASGYNPMKYIRANKLLEGVDINSLPDIKMKDKYSFNNYKNSSSMPINNSNFNKKYSFEDYKLKKSSTIQNNNSNINNINTINNNINNIPNIEKPLNPYSYEAYKKRTQSLDTLKRPHQNNNINNMNNNADFYQSNLNLVMNSIINKDCVKQLNPFNNINNEESNPYLKNNNENNNKNVLNPYNTNNNNININNNKKFDSDDDQNPYSNIFNNKNNNNNNNKIYNPYSGTYDYQQQNNNNNNNNSKKPPDKYNFGF